MPQDPFIREKFTRERSAARKLAQEYFERYPCQDRCPHFVCTPGYRLRRLFGRSRNLEAGRVGIDLL